MNVHVLMDSIEAKGIHVRLDGDRIKLSPKSELTPELIDEVRDHKPELLHFLRSEWPRQCLNAQKRWGNPHSILYPLIGKRISTSTGRGQLLQVLNQVAAVHVEGHEKVSFVDWREVRPSPETPPEMSTKAYPRGDQHSPKTEPGRR